jgi:hypothetical protein
LRQVSFDGQLQDEQLSRDVLRHLRDQLVRHEERMKKLLSHETQALIGSLTKVFDEHSPACAQAPARRTACIADGLEGRTSSAVASTMTENEGRSSMSGDRKSLQAIAQEEAKDQEKEKEDPFIVFRVARWIAGHRRFEAAVATLIFLNTISIGVQADWAVKHIGEDNPRWLWLMQFLFTCAFTAELLVRIVDENRGFFKLQNKNVKWNLFDTFVVGAAILEEVMVFSTETMTLDVSAIRVLRIVRLVRIFRVLRVMRFFRELRTMVQGIMSSVRSLIWCILLLLILIFVFGACVLQTATEKMNEDFSLGKAPAHHQTILSYYGSLLLTMYTLYLTITGGVSWGEAAKPLIEVSPYMLVLYSIYIAFAVLCVLNIVTGVFVENANAITRCDADNMVMEELNAREKWLDEMRAVFEKADETGSGDLDVNEFVKYVQDVRVQAYFRKIGLNVEKDNSRALFSLIDLDSNGVIELSEFVEGCAQFVGTARQLDIARLRRDNRSISKQVKELKKLMQDYIGLGDECLPQGALHRNHSMESIEGQYLYDQPPDDD